ncbi:CsgG/HfaB family protein [Candidatus Neomarinimicrobiota bacterium]
MSFIMITCCALVLFPTQASSQSKESYAVMDLEGRGISALEAATLTDRMRSEMVKTGAVTVVERGQMQSILAEQDFQMTGCTSDECAVEIGQMLGITKMIAGSIGKIGSTFTVDLRTINIGTGAIENTMTRDYKGEIDGLITTIERISWELVGLVHPDELLQDLLDQPPTSLEEVATRQPQQEEPEPTQAAAKPKKKGGKRLLMAAVVIVGGGGAYYVLTQGGEDTPYEPPSIGMPPNFDTP